jgi:hypothetical protein
MGPKSDSKASDRDKPRGRERRPEREFEVAYYTKELGRPLQRKMLQGRLDDFAHRTITAASHGEDTDPPRSPPRQDRAG